MTKILLLSRSKSILNTLSERLQFENFATAESSSINTANELCQTESFDAAVVDGEMDLGEFGRIHFIDWDQTRGRTRTVQIMIIGE